MAVYQIDWVFSVLGLIFTSFGLVGCVLSLKAVKKIIKKKHYERLVRIPGYFGFGEIRSMWLSVIISATGVYMMYIGLGGPEFESLKLTLVYILLAFLILTLGAEVFFEIKTKKQSERAKTAIMFLILLIIFIVLYVILYHIAGGI